MQKFAQFTLGFTPWGAVATSTLPEDVIGASALARRAEELARRFAAKLAGVPELRRPMHGDFSANQVVMGRFEVAIVDLDWARPPSPSGCTLFRGRAPAAGSRQVDAPR